MHDGFTIVEQNTSDRAAWGFRKCPFLFNAGAPMVPDHANNNFTDYSDSNFVRVCLDEPTGHQTLRLPDANPDPLSAPSRPLSMGTKYERDILHRQGNQPWSRTYSFSAKQHRWRPSLSGIVISTGNMHDLAGLPGLMSRIPSLQFTGTIERADKSVVWASEIVNRARFRCCYSNVIQDTFDTSMVEVGLGNDIESTELVLTVEIENLDVNDFLKSASGEYMKVTGVAEDKVTLTVERNVAPPGLSQGALAAVGVGETVTLAEETTSDDARSAVANITGSCFNGKFYQHQWSIHNSNITNVTRALKWAEHHSQLDNGLNAPNWFYKEWLHLDGSSMASAVPRDLIAYLFPNLTCYTHDKVSGQELPCDVLDINASMGYYGRPQTFASFVRKPQLTSLRESARQANVIMEDADGTDPANTAIIDSGVDGKSSSTTLVLESVMENLDLDEFIRTAAGEYMRVTYIADDGVTLTVERNAAPNGLTQGAMAAAAAGSTITLAQQKPGVQITWAGTRGLIDDRFMGLKNETRPIIIAQGCNIFDMSQEYFDFYRIYYKVSGWEDLVRRTVFRMEALYPDHPQQHWQDRLAKLRGDGFFSQQNFLGRFEQTEAYANINRTMKTSRYSDRSSPSTMSWPLPKPLEWTSKVNASRAAARQLRMMMQWFDASPGPGSSSLLLLAGGLKTAPGNLTGYYRVVDTREGRPLYEQCMTEQDKAKGVIPNYIYATTEWYSNIEMWAVGPDIGSTDTWLKVNSEAQTPDQIKEEWRELSEAFPVGYHSNEDIVFLPAATNVSQAELALQWAHVMLGEPINASVTVGEGRAFEGNIDIGEITDAERCFVCSCNQDKSAACGGLMHNREFSAAPAGQKCLLSDWGYECFDLSAVQNMSAALSFETPHADRFQQFPAASGRVVSTGSLQDITSLGVQGTPIMGFSRRDKTNDISKSGYRTDGLQVGGQQAVTQLRFGGHETTGTWPPSTAECLAIGCSPVDPVHTNIPEQLFGCHCAPDVIRRDTDLWDAVPARADLLQRNFSANASEISNVLNLPANDGILLSTGNLEDVTLDSSSMTGLNITGDLVVHGWLQFGSGKHAGSCDWTECSDPAHMQTSGFLIPTSDHVLGWEKRAASICSETELGLPVGLLANPTEWLTLDNTCWNSKFGSYCFQLQVSRIEECLSVGNNESRSLVVASRYNIAKLTSGLGTTDLPYEIFNYDCKPDPFFPHASTSAQVCLVVFRYPIDEHIQKGLSRKPRYYLTGGGDDKSKVAEFATKLNHTRIRRWQWQVADVYQCLNKACGDLFDAETILDLVDEPVEVLTRITTDYCAAQGIQALSAETDFQTVN